MELVIYLQNQQIKKVDQYELQYCLGFNAKRQFLSIYKGVIKMKYKVTEKDLQFGDVLLRDLVDVIGITDITKKEWGDGNIITLFVNDTDIYNETFEEIKHIMILHGYILISLGYDTYLKNVYFRFINGD